MMMFMCNDEPAASEEAAQVELVIPPAEDEAMAAPSSEPTGDLSLAVDAASDPVTTPAPTAEEGGVVQALEPSYPEAAPLDAGSSFPRFFAANHSWVAVCASEPAVPCYVRAQILAISLLWLMGGVAVLYEFLYPELGCSQYTNEASCLEMTSPYDPNESACEWDPNRTPAPTPPPTPAPTLAFSENATNSYDAAADAQAYKAGTCGERKPDAEHAFTATGILGSVIVMLMVRLCVVGVERLYLRVFNAPRPPCPLWQKLLAAGMLVPLVFIMVIFVLLIDHGMIDAWFSSTLIAIVLSAWVYEPAEMAARYFCCSSCCAHAPCSCQ